MMLLCFLIIRGKGTPARHFRQQVKCSLRATGILTFMASTDELLARYIGLYVTAAFSAHGEAETRCHMPLLVAYRIYF